MARDPFAIATLIAVGILIVRAWGGPLGEPVAEDFDFIQHARYAPFSLFDGGGSTAFWRPIPHQIYYRLLAPLMTTMPGAVAALHALVLTAASLLLYRAFRTWKSGPWAAAVATAPLLSESTRTWIAWPSHFVDLGLWFFIALALHETSRRRLWTAAAALLGALLCKEVAVIAALFLPLVPGRTPLADDVAEGRRRVRWLLTFAAVVAMWAIAYLTVRTHAGLRLPHHMETAMATATWWDRLGWALGGSVRALVSLPLVETAWERSIGALLALLALVWAAIGARDARTRRGWRSVLPWTLWGLGWFLAAAATLTTVFPYWMPNRSGFGSIGLVAAAAELAGAVHPLLIGGLVAVRIAALALAPAPPAMISVAAPQTGAFLDFEQLVRLQRLMLETRQALAPRLAGVHSPRVAELRMPVQARYAFGGSNALRTWSRDPEAEAIPTQELRADAPDPRLTAVAEFEPNTTPQVVVVEPGAMYAYLEGYARVDAGDHARGLELLARADSLQRNRGAQSFLGTVAGERSFALLALGRDAEAEREAKLGAQLFAFNVTARAVLGQLALERGDLQTAAAHADSILRWRRDDPVGLNLRAQILRAAREAPK